MIALRHTDRPLWMRPFTRGYVPTLTELGKPSGDIRQVRTMQVFVPGTGLGAAEGIASLSPDGQAAPAQAVTAGTFEQYLQTGFLPGQVLRVPGAAAADGAHQRIPGRKRYELTDHLGNVRATVTDLRSAASAAAATGKANVKSVSDYYPFGMPVRRSALPPSHNGVRLCLHPAACGCLPPVEPNLTK